MTYIISAGNTKSCLGTGNNKMVFLILILMLVTFGAVLFIPALLTRKAISKVIKIFYQHHALGIDEAKTLLELGLARPDFFQRMTRPRDYKQYALQVLMKQGTIVGDADGRLYLIEEKLDQNLRRKKRD
jgi:hypothetical protein